ncbi:MAG: hypothetical protein ACOZF2_14375 [Thermodesulfobacteriota bacterium]
MSERKLFSQVQEIETLFSAYLDVIYGARQDTLRIISSLEAVVLNLDLLEAASPVAGSPWKSEEDLGLLTAQVRELALMALSAASSTVTMIQKNIPKAQEGAAKTSKLLAKWARQEVLPENDSDSLILILVEIKNVAHQAEEDAVRCVAAVRALLPQVENLHNRMVALLPRRPDKHDSPKENKAEARKQPKASLYIVDGVH